MDAVAVKTNKGGVEQEFWRLKPKKKKDIPSCFLKTKKIYKAQDFWRLKPFSNSQKSAQIPQPTA
jgi:hypothetical protein